MEDDVGMSLKEWFRELSGEVAAVSRKMDDLQQRMVRLETLGEVTANNEAARRLEFKEIRREMTALTLKITAIGVALSGIYPALKIIGL